MKKQFDLHIYLSDIKHLLNLEETLRIIPNPGPEFMDILDENVMGNQASLTLLKDYMYKYFGLHYEGNIKGVYYGQETCENLIPSLKFIEQAVEYCAENEYLFSFATPYVGIRGMEKLRKIFGFLNEKAPETEVVVNDYGVLHLLNTEYPDLKSTLGRLLIKTKRDPRFSISGYEIANIDIKNLKRVESNQTEALLGSTLELPVYQDFLKRKGVKRVGFDVQTQGINRKIIMRWGFPVDLYWPWTYVTSNRNCLVAAHTQPGKESHPTEEPCSYQCKKYEFAFRSDKKMFSSVARGNAIWMNTKSLHLEYFKAGFDRLIYEPYIPV
ncbi:MAG: hypothetical protein JXB24_02305 [Bacteroidales bacterium]|nr:hypothetical protein [Bacteroidales bacterium]